MWVTWHVLHKKPFHRKLIDVIGADNMVPRHKEYFRPIDVVAQVSDLIDIDDCRLLGAAADSDEAHRKFPVLATPGDLKMNIPRVAAASHAGLANYS